MGRFEELFLMNLYHLTLLQRTRRKKNMIDMLCIKMGLHIYIKVARHKTKNLLTLQVSEGYLETLI